MKALVKSAALFLLRVTFLYAILLACWPAVNELYSTAFHKACGIFEGQVGSAGRVSLLSIQPDSALDLVFQLSTDDSTVALRRVSSYFTGYLPTVFLVSLILGTRITLRRRLIAFIAALLMIHAFMLFKIGVAAYSVFATQGPLRLVDLGSAPTTLLLYLHTLLNESSLTIFSVPAGVWFIVCFRREDFPFLADLPSLERSARPRAAIVAGSLFLVVVLGGFALAQSERWQQSVWRSAAGAERFSPQEHSSRAASFMSKGDLDAAAEELESAIRAEPGNHEAYFNLGKVRVRQVRPASAIQAFEEAIRLAPEYVDARYWLGTTLGMQ